MVRQFECAACGAQFASPILIRRHVSEEHTTLAPTVVSAQPAAPSTAVQSAAGTLTRTEVDQLVQSAIQLHQQGSNDQAKRVLASAAEAAQILQHPQQKQVWYFLGVVCNAVEDHQGARGAYEMAISLDCGFANAHCNLGRTHELSGNIAAAIKHSRACVASDPTSAAGHCNLSSALKSNGDYIEANAAAKETIRLAPAMVEGYINLADSLIAQGKFKDALGPAETALQMRPEMAVVHKSLGSIYKGLGRLEDAISMFEQTLRLDTTHLDVRHILAGLKGEKNTMAPVEYTESLFDAFAVRYDNEMTVALNYKCPSLLHALVGRATRFERAADYAVLDLGCGTGLGGEVFKSMASQLIGCDLSSKMLDMARGKGIYTDLRQGELVAVLTELIDAGKTMDLVIACDVLCYIGDLDDVMRGVAAVLQREGIFAFSVEALYDSSEYVLKQTGRYGHSAAYVQDLAVRHGLREAAMETVMLRTEGAGSITGNLFVFRKVVALALEDDDDLPSLEPKFDDDLPPLEPKFDDDLPALEP